MGIPKVILVGRTNVGKSTLFNRLASDAQSIVYDREGVTRDYIKEIMNWRDKTFDLIDTGGFPIKKQKDPILEEVRKRVIDLINEADFIVFVCDVKAGVLKEDQQIAQIIRKSKRPSILALNKSDNKTAYEEFSTEFHSLGFEIIPISATHGIGVGLLLEKITDVLPEVAGVELEPAYKIAILGKPNVGKSSLMNLIIKKERSIVSEIPGTTREAISEKIAFHKENIQLTDTPGVRRSKKIDDELEELMVKSSFAAVRDSDIVILVVDSSQGKISDQELKLLFYAYEQKKSLILVFNKSDLLTEDLKASWKSDLSLYKFIIDKILQVTISCKEEKNIGKLLSAVLDVRQRSKQEFKVTEINDIVKSELRRRPLFTLGHELEIRKLTHVKARAPTFLLFVRNMRLWQDSQVARIENILRENYDLKGCAVQIFVREF